MKRRDTIVRYTAPERINHWITAFCFILAAVSGLGFLFPSFNWLMQIMGTPQLARILHPFVGVVMFASFIIMFFRYWHHNLINRDDIFWAKNIRKIVVNEEDVYKRQATSRRRREYNRSVAPLAGNH